MERRRGGGHGGGGGHDGSGGLRWLLTYADMITLLLALFIYLYSISSIDAAKLSAFSSAFAELFGVSRSPIPMAVPSGSEGVIPIPGRKAQPVEEKPPSEKTEPGKPGERQGEGQGGENEKQLSDLMTQFQKDFPDMLSKGSLTLLKSEGGLMLRLSDTALFDLGRAEVSPQATALLDSIAERIRTLPNAVRVEGHTDSLPLRGGPYQSNWLLSGARAASVVEYFITSGGIQPERLSLAGYGEYRPIAPNSPTLGNPANRRVEIMVLANPPSRETEAVPASADNAQSPDVSTEAPPPATPPSDTTSPTDENTEANTTIAPPSEPPAENAPHQ